MTLILRGVRIAQGTFSLAADVEIRSAVTGVVGPSGSGKTTLLEIVSGLKRPDEGLVMLGGRVLDDARTGEHLRTRERRVGYVPQDGALFPHLSVRRNLLYGFRPRSLGASPDVERVVEVLDLGRLMDRTVPSLSGGEKQRAALGRAILSSPEIILLDEPLAGLDAPRKARILPFLRRVRDGLGVPMIYVTHHPDEVLALCTEVLSIREGRLTAM